MATTESTLVDSNTTYCDVSDVERYIRMYSAGSTSDPTQSQVEDWIEYASDKIDAACGQAWRTRKVTDIEIPVKLTHEQSKRVRDRTNGFSSRGLTRGQYAFANAPHMHIQSVSNVEAILPDNIETMNSDEYRVSERQGVIRPDFEKFGRGNQLGATRNYDTVPSPKIKATYEYGRSTIPADVREAAAKIAAAQIIKTQSFGQSLQSGSSDVSPQDLANDLTEDAKDDLGNRVVEPQLI